jgi:hypothetical protein
VFLSYDLKAKEKGFDRFVSKEQGFSIGWYPDLKAVHGHALSQ